MCDKCWFDTILKYEYGWHMSVPWQAKTYFKLDKCEFQDDICCFRHDSKEKEKGIGQEFKCVYIHI